MDQVGTAHQAVRILLVEDDDTIRSGVAMILRAQGYAVVDHGDGTAALGELAKGLTELAILDIGLMDGPDGLALARRAKTVGARVIFISARGSLEERLAGFDAGADDYLVKPFDMSELLARVRAVLGRSAGGQDALITVGDLTIDPATHRVFATSEITLTLREYNILLVLASNRGRVLSKPQLYERAWGEQPTASWSDNIVEVHVSSLRKKLEPHVGNLILTVRGVGYRLPDP